MNDELMDRQIKLEREMQTTGELRYHKHTDEAKTMGLETSTKYGNSMLAEVVFPIAHAIRTYLKDAAKGAKYQGAGRKDVAFRYLLGIEPEVAAYITAKAVFNTVSSDMYIQNLLLSIGSGIEDEMRFRHFEKECRPLWRKLVTNLKQRTSSRQWQRTVLVNRMGKAKIHWDRWPTTDKAQIGAKCLEALLENKVCKRWFYVQNYRRGKNKSKIVLRVTQEGVEYIKNKNAKCALMEPRLLPMLAPPNPWVGPLEGGYYSLHWDIPLVKTTSARYLEELSYVTDEMSEVYDAVNAIQNVPWRVNRKVLEVLDVVFHDSLPLGNLPAYDPIPLPTKPIQIDTNAELRIKWRREAAMTHLDNARRASKSFQVASLIVLAERYKDEVAFYLPHQLDFRGRIYALTTLSPQGPDYCKALLTFARGKPINNEVALGRLMIHGANCYGYDKVNLDERIGWVVDHEDDILRVAADPLQHTWWSDADEPWQFLAFCLEYAAFQAHGWGYVSSLPCNQDGSCNGLQHFSAMLRDKVGGAAVNLVPADQPADIYALVVNKVKEQLRWARLNSCVTPDDGNKVYGDLTHAVKWLALEPDRKLTKRPVMTLPYGATRHSCREYVEDWLRDERPAHDFTGEGELFSATLFMSRLIWDAIGDTVVAAKSAMTWLQQVAKLAAQDDIPASWITPDGFPVVQCYFNVTRRRVTTKIGDSTLCLTLVGRDTQLDARLQANGISPNFVHSLDATVLRQYVLTAKENGVRDVALVHDSFGTVAADAEMSARCQRLAFIGVYQQSDVIANFRRDITAVMPPEMVAKIPPSPTLGELDLSLIEDQDYFSV